MKLSKIYSNKPFHNTRFNLSLNVIYGDVKAISGPNSKHSIGKTKLILLLDFLLLKSIVPKNHFLTSTKDSTTKTLKFNGYEFYLELLLNSGKFLTIKRTVNESSKVAIHLSNKSTKDFAIPLNWDYENQTIDEAIKIVNANLNFDFFKNLPELDFRDTINYSLRVPDTGDYNDLFKLGKFTFGEKKWKTFMFSLLGFDSSDVKEKYDVEDEIKLKTKIIKEQEEGFDINSGQKDEIEGFKKVLEKQKADQIRDLDGLNFYSQDEKLIEKLVEEIEVNISELNKVSYNLHFEIRKIQESLKSEFNFDINMVKSLFNQVDFHFPEKIMKSYEELVEFNKQITSDRKKLLEESLQTKTQQLRDVKLDLIEMNKEKDKYREVIQDTSVFKKLKEYQTELIKLENEIAKHEAKLDAITVIEGKKNEIEPLAEKLKIAVQKIKAILDTTGTNERYSRIRSYFSDFAQAILKHPAIISMSPNTNNNIEYKYAIGDTKKADGNTYTKMLCIAFDLAILAEYSTESYFKFVYHDDVFSNQENKIRVRFLKLLQEYCEKYGIQYIFSIIRDDFPRDDNDKIIEFEEDEIVMRLDDNSDAGKLFKMSF
jgi:uncharacterized protein YydD (DUF2326 family)